MDTTDALKTIMKARGYTQTSLADSLGVTQPAVSSVVNADSPAVDTLTRYLAAMGYRVAFVPAGTRLPEGCIEID